MNYISILYRARNVIRLIAKICAWIFGIYLALYFTWAAVADAPLPFISSSTMRFVSALAVMHLVPRFIDAIIRRLADRSV